MDTKRLITCLMEDIRKKTASELNLMEVCGTHTRAFFQSGIREMLPPSIRLLSGPGCPVCVTDEACIDAAIALLKEKDIHLATFGDMLRVRGTHESLSDQFGKRGNVSIAYSPLDCLALSKKLSGRQLVFLAVGFETTAPSIALAVKLAKENGIGNLSFLMALKRMPPVLHHILAAKRNRLHGIICPGHVAAVMGARYFSFIAQEYAIPAVICGFEAMDMACGIYMLTRQCNGQERSSLRNLYKTCVGDEGNATANKLLQEVFEVDEASWRGIGRIKDSAYVLSSRYKDFDALNRFCIRLSNPLPKSGCSCGDVIIGNILPYECRMFEVVCRPQNPLGPCMVSSEGSCAIYFNNGRVPMK